MKSNLPILFICVIIFSISIQLFAQASYEIIDIGPGGISAISKNGQYACGMNYPSPGFVWSETTGRIELTQIQYSEAYDVSNNGRVVGRFYDSALPAPGGNPTLRAAYWENGSWNRLNGLDGLVPLDEMSFTHAYGISADGTTICGMQWHPNWSVEAVRWINEDVSGLGQTYGRNSRANVVSYDGSVIAGWNAGPDGIPDRSAFYWDPTPHFMGGFDPTYLVGEAGGISSDGSIIVGTSVWPFIWTASTGMRQIVPDSSLYEQGYALGVSDDATVIGWVDPVGGGFNYKAFIKKASWNNIVYLSNYISDSLGITSLNGWYIPFGQAISADGKTIGMTAYNLSGEPRAILLKINDPLPVELTSFTAETFNSTVILRWSTATELNNSGFEIQRTNGNENSNWNSIGFINGNGTSSTQYNYNFTDKTPQTGTNKYRLKQINFDGTFEYTSEVEAQVIAENYFLAQNFPNPFNPSTTINFNLPKEDFVNLVVFNSIGEKVTVLYQGSMEAGLHSLTFNATGLASGLYVLKMTSGNYTQTIKMNLMK